MLRDTSALKLIDQIYTTEETKSPPPAFSKPEWWDGKVRMSRNKMEIRMIVKDFLTGNLKRRVRHMGCGGNHKYTTRKNGTELWLFKDNHALKFRVCVAKKIDGVFLGNASSIAAQKINGKMNWLRSGRQEMIQEALSECMTMVPFRMFEENKFDINTMRIIEKGPEETVNIHVSWKKDKRVFEDRHFTGALLFKMKGKKSDQYFLFDIDRGDLKTGGFNPFLSRIPVAAKSIAEAYASLKPQEVRDAERFLKRECVRQGEWFFIPVPGEFKKAPADWGMRFHYGFKDYSGILASKGNRPHFAQFHTSDGLVTGKIAHGGYEHPVLKLEGWHKPVPNTAIQSFTISGGID